MRTARSFVVLATALGFVMLVGCATSGSVRHAQGQGLVAPLPKLTAAVLVVVRYSDQGQQIPDNTLVSEAIKDKPELQEIFRGVNVKVRHSAKHVVLLVCSPNEEYAWLEDASWTPGVVDHNWTPDTLHHPAEFTMDPLVIHNN